MNHLFFPSLWRSSKLDQLLESNQSFTLELLEQDDILEESRFLNEKLVRVLATRDAVEALFHHMLYGPHDVEERPAAARFPNICCEILNYGIASINQTIFQNEDLLDSFFSFLQKKDVRVQNAAYFAKIVVMFLEHQKVSLYNYVKERPHIVKNIIDNLHIDPFAGLILSFIKADQSETVGFISWLNANNLVPSVLDKMSDPDAYSSVCQLLSDMVTVSSYPSELVSQIDNADCVKRLLGNALQGRPTCNLNVDGIDVVQTLIKWHKEAADASAARAAAADAASKRDSGEFNPLTMDGGDFMPRAPTPPPNSGPPVVMEDAATLQAVYAVLPDLCSRLKTDAPDIGLPPLSNPRFGSFRMKLLHFFTTLLQQHASLPALPGKLAELELVPAVVGFLFSFVWNSMLHQSIETFLRAVLDCRHQQLAEQFFTKSEFISRTIASFSDEKAGAVGHNGQLIAICNYFMEQQPSLVTTYLADNNEWKLFAEEKLGRLNRLHNAQLGTLAMTEFASLVDAGEALPDVEELDTTSMLENAEGDIYSPPVEPTWY